MKRFLSVFTAAVSVMLCIFGLSACDSGKNNTVEVTDVTLDVAQITLTQGEDYTLTATVMPSNATDRTVEWSSSNESAVTVYDGSVVALAPGVATITVTTSNGKTATCTVTVEAEESEPPTLYTVTFYAQGGTFGDGNDTYEMQVSHNGKLIDNVTVTRGDKYVFTRWYKDEYCNTAWDFNEDTVTEDTRLFAGWKYLNKYQSVIDALAERIKTERQDSSTDVEILSLFADQDGYLCFVEMDDTDVFSYKTGIRGFETVAENAEIVAEIPNTTLTQLKDYNDVYTSENNALIADCMAYKYTPASDPNDAIIYSCVSDWELYSEGKFSTNGPWYSCRVKALVADDDGKVYDCSFKVVSGYADFNMVLGGMALSEEVDLVVTELGELSNDFYAEYLKTINA